MYIIYIYTYEYVHKILIYDAVRYYVMINLIKNSTDELFANVFTYKRSI